jgi:hypothetical protein
MAETRASASTKTRMGLLETQIGIALRQLTTLSEQALQSVLSGVESKLIEYIILYGLDASNRARIELVMRIDWARYELRAANDEGIAAIDERQQVIGAPEVTEMAQLFDDYVNAKGLRVECRVTYRAGVDRDAANQQLGSTRARSVRWAGEWSSWAPMPVEEVDELTLELSLVA